MDGLEDRSLGEPSPPKVIRAPHSPRSKRAPSRFHSHNLYRSTLCHADLRRRTEPQSSIRVAHLHVSDSLRHKAPFPEKRCRSPKRSYAQKATLSADRVKWLHLGPAKSHLSCHLHSVSFQKKVRPTGQGSRLGQGFHD